MIGRESAPIESSPSTKLVKVYPSTQQREIVACSLVVHEGKTLLESASTAEGFRALIGNPKNVSVTHEKIRKKLTSEAVVQTLCYDSSRGSGCQGTLDDIYTSQSFGASTTEPTGRGIVLHKELEDLDPKLWALSNLISALTAKNPRLIFFGLQRCAKANVVVPSYALVLGIDFELASYIHDVKSMMIILTQQQEPESGECKNLLGFWLVCERVPEQSVRDKLQDALIMKGLELLMSQKKGDLSMSKAFVSSLHQKVAIPSETQVFFDLLMRMFAVIDGQRITVAEADVLSSEMNKMKSGTRTKQLSTLPKWVSLDEACRKTFRAVAADKRCALDMASVELLIEGSRSDFPAKVAHGCCMSGIHNASRSLQQIHEKLTPLLSTASEIFKKDEGEKLDRMQSEVVARIAGLKKSQLEQFWSFMERPCTTLENCLSRGTVQIRSEDEISEMFDDAGLQSATMSTALSGMAVAFADEKEKLAFDNLIALCKQFRDAVEELLRSIFVAGTICIFNSAMKSFHERLLLLEVDAPDGDITFSEPLLTAFAKISSSICSLADDWLDRTLKQQPYQGILKAVNAALEKETTFASQYTKVAKNLTQENIDILAQRIAQVSPFTLHRKLGDDGPGCDMEWTWTIGCLIPHFSQVALDRSRTTGVNSLKFDDKKSMTVARGLLDNLATLVSNIDSAKARLADVSLAEAPQLLASLDGDFGHARTQTLNLFKKTYEGFRGRVADSIKINSTIGIVKRVEALESLEPGHLSELVKDEDAISLRNAWSEMMGKLKKRDEPLPLVTEKLPVFAQEARELLESDQEVWRADWAAINSSIAIFTALRVLARPRDDEETKHKTKTAWGVITQLQKDEGAELPTNITLAMEAKVRMHNEDSD